MFHVQDGYKEEYSMETQVYIYQRLGKTIKQSFTQYSDSIDQAGL